VGLEAFEPGFRSQRWPVLGTRGMVASSQPLATAAGLAMLRRGGNAADAAVATAAALAVTEPCNTGPGGDCFALHYRARTGSVSALDGSGRSPSALDLARLASDGFAQALPPHHPHTVTVPGAPAGWCDLAERFGSLPLDALLAPAVELAEDGFPVGPNTAFIWELGARTQLAHAPNGAELLIDGRAPRPGERFRNPGLARTLRRLAEHGAEGFYRGEVAEAVVRVVRDHGGVLSAADLAEHRSAWREPLSAVVGGLRVHECPPAGQGLAALLALRIARGLDLGDDPLAPRRLHLLVEAMRLAFEEARRSVADPAFAEVPVEDLLSEGWAEERRRRIDPDRAHPAPAPAGAPRGSDTVYLCAVDAEGNACSFINSNYQFFGTGIVPAGCGFSLQNRGSGFSLDPRHPNRLEPRKRPYHTIMPGLLTREADGSLYGPFGVMGGFMQPQGHLQVVVAMALDGLDPQAALDRPRFHLPEGTAASPLDLESDVPEATADELARRGHAVRRVPGWGRLLFGRGQAIRRDPDGVLWGGSDPRAEGCAMVP